MTTYSVLYDESDDWYQRRIMDETGEVVFNYAGDVRTAEARCKTVVAALNATASAPDLTATVNRILNTLHHQGLTTWGCLSIEDAEACRAEAYAAVMDILKDGTP